MNKASHPIHRVSPPLEFPEVYSFSAPFSSFSFVESRFLGCRSIRRAFSLARSTGKCRTLVIERIGLNGLLAEENEELASLGFFGGRDVFRVSFWRSAFNRPDSIAKLLSEDLIGYFIAKRDGKTEEAAQWYVFESVFRKYDHPHNCVSRPTKYVLNVGEKQFSVQGVLYCQQNGLNKACAHVALRSILSRMVPDGDVSYSNINTIASKVPGCINQKPSEGLSTEQIKAVLEAFKVPYCDMDYDAAEAKGIHDIRHIHPYQNDLYAGVESGYGALLGFRLGNPERPISRHIIPFYGHTFNKDTWVTDAENFYFNIGEGAGYVPSVNWTSSFIGHDDNFGSNFCVPQLYVKPEQVDYVAAIYPHGVDLMGSDIALLALPILSELYPAMPSGNKWLSRLKAAFSGSVPKVVFRTICIETAKYFDKLAKCRDWDGHIEAADLIAVFLKARFPKWIQVVEVSLPQLFAANERKLGDIVFDAEHPRRYVGSDISKTPFLFARLPGSYFMLDLQSGGDNRFSAFPSLIKSHVPVLTEL